MNRAELIRSARRHVQDRLRELRVANPNAALEEDPQHAERFLGEWLEHEARRRLGLNEQALTRAEEQEIGKTVFNQMFGLGELQAVLEDQANETIYINGPHRVFVDRSDGSKSLPLPISIADTSEDLEEMVRRLAAREGLNEQRWDKAAATLDLTLRDGNRLNAVRDVVREPTITIRRHQLKRVSLQDLVSMGTLVPFQAALLEAAILSSQTTMVSGAMSAGKTTLARALAGCIPPQRRIVTIEQPFELHLDEDVDAHPNCVAMEARDANVMGLGAITIEDLFVNALRMSADVLIVGEVKNGAQALPMLMATAGGEAGSISTIHAKSAAQTLPQLQTYILMGEGHLPLQGSAHLIKTALDFVVYIERRQVQKGVWRRIVTSIAEVRDVVGDRVSVNVISSVDRNGDHHASLDRLSEERRELLEDVGYVAEAPMLSQNGHRGSYQ